MSMFKKAIVAVAAAALLAGPAAAQQGQGAGQGRSWEGADRARNPVSALLAQREALGLDSEQVRQLEAIQARVERENAPRIERIRAVLGDRPFRDLSTEERVALRERMRELDPVRAEIRETNRAAMAEARAVLTAEQQTRLRDVMRRGRAVGDRQPGVRGQGPRAGDRVGRPGAAGRGVRPAPGLQGQGRLAPVPGGMAARVLEQRDALGLTPEQVTRLEAVRDRVEQENEGRIEKLRSTGDDRAGLIEAIRASHRESLAAVREILTDEQEAKLRALAPAQGRRSRR